MPIKHQSLRRYWIGFDPPELHAPPYVALVPWRYFGCGVAAFSREDALEMVQTILRRAYP